MSSAGSDDTPMSQTEISTVYLHILDLFGATSTTRMGKLLTANGYKDNPHQLQFITDAEIDGLSAGTGKNKITIKPAEKGHLRIYRSFFQYKTQQRDPISDDAIVNIGKAEYKSFSQTVYLSQYLTNNIPPAAHSTTTQPGPVEAFKKGIKRDPSVFPNLKSDAGWDFYSHSLRAHCVTQGCGNVVANPLYIPISSQDKELFNLQQEYMYSVFLTTLHTDKGKAIVRSHEKLSDAQAVYAELVEYYEESIKAALNQRQILTYLTHERLGSTSSWRGDSHSFILHFVEQMRKHDNLVVEQERLTEAVKFSLLAAAVTDVPTLAAVETQSLQLQTQVGNKLTYEKYLKLLLATAIKYDKQMKDTSARRPTSRRNTYQADSSGSYDTDPPVFDIDTDIETIQAYAATSRVPDDRWQQLTNEDRQTWMRLTPEARTTILGAPPEPRAPARRPPPPPPRPVAPSPQRRTNYHGITVEQFIAMSHDLSAASTAYTPSVPLSPDAASSLLANEHNTTATQDTVPTSNVSSQPPSVFPGNIHAVLSPTHASQGNARQTNSMHVLYRCHQSSGQSSTPGSLVDRGSNGGIGGDDVRVIAFHPHRKIDVQGIDNHTMNNLRVATCGGVVSTNLGPHIAILHQYAYTGRGASIHSPGQLEWNGCHVDDKSTKVGGSQCITVHGNVKIPLDLVDGLPRMHIRPYTNKEWDTLPHLILTSDSDWNPRALDHIISDSDAWLHEQSPPAAHPNNPHFSEFGDYRHRTVLEHHSSLPALLPQPDDASSVDSSHSSFSLGSFIDHLALKAHKHRLNESQVHIQEGLPTTLEFSDTESLYSFYSDVDDLDWSWDIWKPTTEVFNLEITSTDAGDDASSYGELAPDAIVYGESDQDSTISGEPILDIGKLAPTPPLPGEGHTPPASSSVHPSPDGPRPPPEPPPDTLVFHGKPRKHVSTKRNFDALRPLFGWMPVSRIQRTFELSTQNARMPAAERLKVHYKSPNPALNVVPRDEDLCTDTVFSDVPAVDDGSTCAQIFAGMTSAVIDVFGMKTESQFVNTLEDVITQRGAPTRLISDNAKSETSLRVQDILRALFINFWQSEPHRQHQNPAERRIQALKDITNRILDRSGAPPDCWLLALIYASYLMNHTYHDGINGIPITRLTGVTPDISPLLRFHFFQEVYYKMDDNSFPSESREEKGHVVGISTHVGHLMTYKILTQDTRQVIHRSDVRPCTPAAANKRVDLLRGEDLKPKPETIKTRKEKILESVPGSNSKQVNTPIFNPTELIGRTFLLDEEKDGTVQRARIIQVIEDHEAKVEKQGDRIQFKVSIGDDKFEDILSYQQVLDHIERDEDNGPILWKFKRIVSHRSTTPKNKRHKPKVMLQIEWETGEVTWEPLKNIKKTDPVTCAIYAKDKGLLHLDDWKEFNAIARRQKKLLRMTRQAKLRSYNSTPIFMFGYEVPRNWEHAKALDKRNGNTKWQDCTRLEMEQLLDYSTFQSLGRKAPVPPGYKKIRVHLVFAVKHDGRHKARLVADGHLTDVPNESVYSGVVSLKGLRLVAFLSQLNGLELWATDIGNAYLEANTAERLVIDAGPEFGELQGHTLVIKKALYGLRTSGLRWHERFAEVLRGMNFKPCKAEPDIWMRKMNDHYEYIAVYVDDLAIASKNPKALTDELSQKHNFKLKGTGRMDYHLGMNFVWDESGKEALKMTSDKYREKILDAYFRMFGEHPSSSPTRNHSPLVAGDHPELDYSELLDNQGISNYQSLIGMLQWAVTIGRFDIQVAVTTMSSFRAYPRVGHLERVKRIFAYLKQFDQAAIRFRTHLPDYSMLPVQAYDWASSVYGNVSELIPTDCPEPLGKGVITTSYFDANLMHCLLTGRSLTAVLHLVNGTPFDWYSKKQSTVETATYGSEFMAGRTCVEQIIDHRNTLRYLGVPVIGRSIVFGDNKSMVDSSTLPHAKLHKRHTILSFHRVREAVASGIIDMHHIDGNDNPADILSKHWSHAKIWPLLKPLLFWQGDTMDLHKSKQLAQE